MTREQTDRMYEYMASVCGITGKVDQAKLENWYADVQYFTTAQIKQAVDEANREVDYGHPTRKAILTIARRLKNDQAETDRNRRMAEYAHSPDKCPFCHGRGHVIVELLQEHVPGYKDYYLSAYRCICRAGQFSSRFLPVFDRQLCVGRQVRFFDGALVLDDGQPRPGMTEKIARKYVGVSRAEAAERGGV